MGTFIIDIISRRHRGDAAKQDANTFSIGRTTRVCPCHACAFFTSKEEEYRVMLPFMAEGLEAGDKLVHILDQNLRGEWLTRLTGAGIDAAKAERSGQLEVLAWEQAHVVDGYFDQHRMLASLERAFAEDDKRYKATRLWSNQEWALQALPGVTDLIEYESRYNLIWPNHNGVTICAYDATKFSSEVMMGMLRTHPFVIVDSMARENPFYVPPEELLKEMRGSGYKPARLTT